MSGGEPRARRRRWWIAAFSALVVAPLLGEVALRHMLFGSGPLAERGAPLRKAALYADPRTETDYWKLAWLFEARGADPGPVQPDPELGWMSRRILPGSYRHKAEAWLGGRRPVLMYGDSFTACLVPVEECWQGLLSASELTTQFALLNYGTWAHGLDQAYLTLQRSLPHYVELDPVVVFGVFVDDDLDRCVLRFRGAPKPWFRLAGADGLEVDYPGPFPGNREYLARNPPSRGSYLWRFLQSSVGGVDHDPATEPAGSIAQKQELTRRILRGIRGELDAAGVEAFFVLFHGPNWFEHPGRVDWRESVLIESLAELSIPYVSSRLALARDSELTGRGVEDYYFLDGGRGGHLTAVGNAAVMPAILAGLRGEFDG